MSTAQPEMILGITGSIAAYKAADLTSQLVKHGIAVNVVMTENAAKLVTPLTFQTLSRRPVITSLWDVPEWRPEHVALAQRTQLMVIAPCTGNMLGKITCGIADDALSTCVLANQAPLWVAPAMNPAMWSNAAVQKNVELLKARGVKFAGPVEGHVACGADGTGRMIEVEELLKMILKEFKLA